MEAKAITQNWSKNPDDGTCDVEVDPQHTGAHLELWFANINSFAAHMDEVMGLAGLGADLIGISEHCLSEDDLEATTSKLRDHAWSSLNALCVRQMSTKPFELGHGDGNF
eukprot:4388311-Amphidinium_carterae.3